MHCLALHAWFMPPMGGMPQPNGPKEEIWASPPHLGPRPKSGLLGYSLTLVYALDIGFEVRVQLGKVLDTQNCPACGPASICVDGSYLIKDLIKYVLTLKLNIHHALNEKSTHNMLNIISQQK